MVGDSNLKMCCSMEGDAPLGFASNIIKHVIKFPRASMQMTLVGKAGAAVFFQPNGSPRNLQVYDANGKAFTAKGCLDFIQDVEGQDRYVQVCYEETCFSGRAWLESVMAQDAVESYGLEMKQNGLYISEAKI